MDLVALGVTPEQGRYDWRAGRWSSLVLSQPLVPGNGDGNTLGAGAATLTQAEVWAAVSRFVQAHQQQLQIDLTELPNPNVGMFENGNVIHVYAQRVVGGIPVRGSGLTALVNHGNLILFALQGWGSLDATIRPTLTSAKAVDTVAEYIKPFTLAGWRQEPHLEIIPLARGQNVETVTAGAGYDYRLAWVVSPFVREDLGTWEALVDATSGELIAFEDKNDYAVRRVVGGVFPVSNDARPPDGLEQPGWPMPFANTVAAGPFTTTGGVVAGCVAGSLPTTLAGQFVRMADNCGAVNETTAANDLDLGISSGTDCVVPAGHSTGDTHSSRTGFYEINRIKEQARGQLPANTWLQQQLQANMNINNTCNAFWNGSTINFYRDNGSQCRNTGEIAAVFDHEWGHGMDDNDVNGNISQPQEGIADAFATLRLDNSCVGRGFFKNQTCGGYGDPCIGTPLTGCTGVRDADFAQHVSGLPHGINWILSNCPGGGAGPCGRAVHCEGQAVSEMIWDLHARDLMAAPYNYDNNTALEIATRIWYLGSSNIQTYYTCVVGGGCSANGAYLTFLGVDDDNGNINDGTPHMTAIRGAFERHQIHCTTPAVIDSGCAGGPTTAPTVIATPTAGGVSLSWGAVAGASNYFVFRSEGVNGCDFGKIKAGQTNGTTWSDSGLLDGRAYNYGVLPVGANSSCFGRMSVCAPVTPLVAPDPCAATNAFVSFALSKSQVAEAGVNATVQVRVTTNNGQATTAPLTVDFTTVDGTAVAPADYTTTSGTLTFPTGTVSGATQNIIVPIIQETLDEFNEDFLVVLSNVAGGALGANVSHVVTIIDDDVPVELQSIVIE
jgi:hypothetical protein